MTQGGGNAERRSVVAVVLAAGAGTRLAPLTDVRPKALCPVGGRALLDLAVERVAPAAEAVAVNLHHGSQLVRAHVAQRAGPPIHLSEEQPEALGTAGAIGALRDWIDGRDVLVVNADTWAPGDLRPFVAAWDRRHPAVLVHGTDQFGPQAGVVASLLPWADAARLLPEPTGLYEAVWRPRHERGHLAVVRHEGPFVDCGTPLDYLEANLAAAGLAGGRIVDPTAMVPDGAVRGRCVVGAGAVVEGRVQDSVLWPGVMVGPGEELVRCVRASAALTVGPLEPLEPVGETERSG